MGKVTHVRRGSGEGRGDREAGALVPGAAEPGSAAVRRRSEAEGETFAESVPTVAEGDVEGAAEAAMAGFLLEILEFMFFLRGARGGVGSAENSRGERRFGEGSGGRRLGSYSRCRFATCIWAGKAYVLIVEPATVGSIVYKRSYAWSGWAGERKLSSAARRAFRLR